MRADSRTERRLDVLRAVVRVFILHGEPVGSKTIAESAVCEVSSATVRNIMAQLEDEGYLAQPHTSSGRIPTAKGYRLYADMVLREPRPRGAADEARALPDPPVEPAELAEFLRETTRALSRLSLCVGLVLHPRFDDVSFRHVRFLRLDRSRVVVLLVGNQGVVADRVVYVDDDLAQDELDAVAAYIANRFEGVTLGVVQRTLSRELGEEQVAFDRALRRWLAFALSCLNRCVASDAVYVEGAAQCVQASDFSDIDQVRGLLRAFEEKGRMARLLQSCVGGQGVQIRIGSDETSEEGLELKGLAFVAAPYGESGRALGSVGVLGPTRMDYEKVIALVEGVAHDLGQVLAGGGAPMTH